MTMTRKAEATRQHILDTGHELVLRRGFTGMGLTELLAACGVPKGSFYHYFASKEQFGCALLENYIDLYQGHIDRLMAADAGNGRARLMRYWSAWVDDPTLECGWAERCLLVKLAAEVSGLSEDMRLVLQGGVEQLLERLTGVVDAGRADGSLPSGIQPRETAATLYQMWLGAALLAKLAMNKAPLLHAFEATERMLACRDA